MYSETSLLTSKFAFADCRLSGLQRHAVVAITVYMQGKATDIAYRLISKNGFYLWVLHPVAYLSNWFFMTPSIATKFQYVNSLLFLFSH
jgi:hypothetical protein